MNKNTLYKIGGGIGIVIILVVVITVVFVVSQKDTEIEKTNQEDTEDMIIDSESFVDQTLSTKEIIDKVPSRSVNESELQGWKSYTSKKLGISFRYPSNYIVVEAKEPDTDTIGAHVSLTVFEDTPSNRHSAKILNPDFDYVIPEDQKNPDFEAGWSQRIRFSKSIEGGFAQDIVEWYKENKSGKNADLDVYTSADFIGIDSVVYQAEGLFTFDGVMFEKDGYLYQLSVQYFDSPESPRDDFYKIISTFKFLD